MDVDQIFPHIFLRKFSALLMASKMRSLTLNFFSLYIASYLPWRFGAKVRGGLSRPPLLFPAHGIEKLRLGKEAS